MRQLLPSILFIALRALPQVVRGAGAGAAGAAGAADPAQEDAAQDDAANRDSTPRLAVNITTQFPQSEIFGVKLVNGLPTEALISFTNNEPDPITVSIVGGSLWTPARGDNHPERSVRNLTAASYNLEVPAAQSESLSYKFATELHPADLILKLFAIVTNEKRAFQTLKAFEGDVSVVERPTSFFDPQIIFLYLVLGAAFGGTGYFIYRTWISTLFPQQSKRRGGKGGERAKTSSRGSKKVDPSDQVSVVGADGPAVTSGAKAYDESWIPQHHIQRPESKRMRSGTPSGGKSKKTNNP